MANTVFRAERSAKPRRVGKLGGARFKKSPGPKSGRKGKNEVAGPRSKLALMAIAAAAAIPILLFASILALHTIGQERAGVEDELWQADRDALREIDSLLGRHIAALQTISAFIDRSDSDVGELYTLAADILRDQYDWTGVRLIDAVTYRWITASAIASQELLPVEAKNVERVVRSGRPMATITPKEAAGEDISIIVSIPVRRDGRVAYVLAAGLNPEIFSETLRRSSIPSGWTAAAIDPNFIIAARNRSQKEFVGTAITPSLRAEIENAAENFFYSQNKEGQTVYTLFTKSPVSDWVVAIGAPAALIQKPLFLSSAIIIGSGGAATLIAAIMAVWLIRSFSQRQEVEYRLSQVASQNEAERRLVEIAHNLPGIIYRCVLRPDGTITYPFVSDDVTHHLGLRPDRLNQPLSFEELTRVLRTDPGGGWHETLERSARTLTPHVVEGSFAAAEGGIRWVRGLGRPHRGQDGAIVWDGVALDITEEKRRELLLREQAETLDTINGINAEIAGELDLERVVRVVTDAVTRLAQGEFAALFYRRADDDRDLPLRYEISGTLKDAFAGMPLGRDTEIFRPTIVGDEVVRLDDVSTDPRYGSDAPFYGIPPGHPSIRSYLSVPVISRSTEIVGTIVLGHRSPGRFDERTEKIVIGIAAQAAIALENARLYQQAQTEIQQRERTQKQQALLLSELDHRVRNTLAVAQSLALSTFAKGEQLETYRNRIRALAHAHGLLAETQWRGANLSTLIEMELAPYKQHDEGERVSITGPEIYLEAETAQTLVLVIHELATNAAKYGALSTSGGRIEVSWDVDNGDKTELLLRWTELSNAKPNVTLHRGFGHQLIERGVEYNLGGNVWLDFGADGFRCEIRVPLSQGGLGGTLPPADDDQSN